MITFKVSKKDKDLIDTIALRAANLATDEGINYPLEDATMDLTAVHATGTPLDLRKLSWADDGNFGHDIFGIRRHLDRTTGQLNNCFSPRAAKPEKKKNR